MISAHLQAPFVALSLFLALVPLGGCKSEQRGGPRVKTIPVTGVVSVDGSPAASLKVECHRDTPDPAFPMVPTAITAADGKFTIGTYEGSDGAPAGNYHLTFVWGEFNLINGQYSGDKLKKKYADPKASEIKLSISDSDSRIDLGELKLSAK
ncbi:MAG: hypothetical protein B7Z55_02355 [Planctomycetales bacterium 12-60-4]|nr:MAG: hypothetical protein B7Z55_02355 [Planctomycetales bacterium 12-60-4]